MAVDDLSVIDFVALNLNGEAVLVISDHLKWDEKNEHLLILQSKINVYLQGIENGSLYEAYPEAIDKSIVIEVKAKYAPNKTGRSFLDTVEKTLKAAGYRFSFEVLGV